MDFIDNISNTVPHGTDEYIGDDGFLYCGKCHRRVETEIEFMGVKRKVRCICLCGKQEIKNRHDEEIKSTIERNRFICFAESNMRTWNFQNDDKRNGRVRNISLKYAENFDNFKSKGQGLLYCGNVGTGKTYYAACVSNRLVDKGYKVLMTNFVRLTNQIQGRFRDAQEYIDSLSAYDLVVVDDLGVERKTEYVGEIVFNIVDSRYRAGLPMIITTNLTAEQLKKPANLEQARIYDRILERCYPVVVDGTSRRREKLRDNFNSMRNILEA